MISNNNNDDNNNNNNNNNNIIAIRTINMYIFKALIN